MIILIDNFDSFTYNIVQAYQQLGEEVKVFRNQAISLEEIKMLNPKLLVIGPGPGNPKTAGISTTAVSLAEAGIPLFGICLGHQAIGDYFGAAVVRAGKAIHGKVYPIFHNGQGLFSGLPQPLKATRYHSLIVTSLPEPLEITAWSETEEIMAIRHKTLPIQGVQFHPESAASEHGLQLLQNSLNLR